MYDASSKNLSIPEMPLVIDTRRARLEKLSILAVAALLDHYANVTMRDVDGMAGRSLPR